MQKFQMYAIFVEAIRHFYYEVFMSKVSPFHQTYLHFIYLVVEN